MNQDAVQGILENYKNRIRKEGLSGEIYKWELIGQSRGRPDLETADLLQELKSIPYKNLLYKMATAVMYHLAEARPESYRNCLKKLFDENRPLADRIKQTDEDMLKLYREVEPKLGHHHDERTMATLLTFHNPEQYTLYKNSFYKKYCSLIGVAPRKKNEKYIHYLELVDNLIENYIKKDHELVGLVEALIPVGAFEDKNHRLLAQDILYQVLENSPAEEMLEIALSPDESVYKVSMGTSEINEQAYDYFKEQKLLVVHGNTASKGRSAQKQGEVFSMGMKEQDYFYLCRSNNNFELIGRITGDAVWCDYENLGEQGWLQRPYEVVAKAQNIKPYQGEQKWWTPNSNSTCILIPERKIDEANIKLFKPFYNVKFIANAQKEIGLNTKELPYKKELEILQKKKQIILQGPPGTGKTYTAKDMAEQLISGQISADKKEQKEKLESSHQFKLIQFHPAYTYEDFVRGITAKNTEGQIKYVTENRLLADFAKQATGSDDPYILIIDEINRANLPAVLGELIYGLEYRGEAVESMYAIDGDNRISLPENLYIIGTMNTADRSVGHIDYAIRRRFAFVEMLPDKTVIKNGKAKELFGNVSKLFEKTFIAPDFEAKDVRLGHSYFLLKNGEDENDLRLKLKYEIIPILEEYLKDGILLETAKDNIENLKHFGI